MVPRLEVQRILPRLCLTSEKHAGALCRETKSRTFDAGRSDVLQPCTGRFFGAFVSLERGVLDAKLHWIVSGMDPGDSRRRSTAARAPPARLVHRGLE